MDAAPSPRPVPLINPPQHQKEYARSWAMLLRKVWEIDPLLCPKCGGAMRVLAVINDQDVVRKILDHLHLWQGLTADEITCRIRDGPVPEPERDNDELTSEPFTDGWATEAEGA